MAWSVEEKLLVVGTQDGVVAVWDTEEEQVTHILTGHTGEAWGVGGLCQLHHQDKEDFNGIF